MVGGFSRVHERTVAGRRANVSLCEGSASDECAKYGEMLWVADGVMMESIKLFGDDARRTAKSVYIGIVG